MKCLYGLQHLKTLDISGTGVTSTAVAKLQNALPNCEIIRECDVFWGEVPTGNPADPFPIAVAPFTTTKKAKWHQQRWADYLGLPVEFENNIGMKMVLIPPGEFWRGSTEEEQSQFSREAEAKGDKESITWISRERPRHRVRISSPFFVGSHEVTRRQFRRFVEATKYETDAERTGKGCGYLNGEWKQDSRFIWNTDLGLEQSDDHPVVNVSWNDAVEFCRWLSRQADAKYYLPTEAQWEYTCRAGTDTFWHSGNEEVSLGAYAWFEKNANGKTHLVGQLRPNAWGLHDMHGNVWEWCADRWQEDYYSLSPLLDPIGPNQGTIRVNRGGSWRDHAENSRSARRIGQYPDRCDCHLGFRPVMLIDPANPPKLSSQPPAESAKTESAVASESKTEEREDNKKP